MIDSMLSFLKKAHFYTLKGNRCFSQICCIRFSQSIGGCFEIGQFAHGTSFSFVCQVDKDAVAVMQEKDLEEMGVEA